MFDPAAAASSPSSGRILDQGPPRPPRQGKSVLSMGMDQSTGGMAGPNGNGAMGLGMAATDPSVQIMEGMAEVRNSLLKLSVKLPPLAPGIQQFIAALEQTVPQMMADLVAGIPPGTGQQPGQGAQMANQAPTAPPVSAGPPNAGVQ